MSSSKPFAEGHNHSLPVVGFVGESHVDVVSRQFNSMKHKAFNRHMKNPWVKAWS
ncbi:MAG: hypothetical protein JKY67_16060, partial [Pseudomonadales bacterium]|nr:hypothetical protein [Pseudomonadales bacterium]